MKNKIVLFGVGERGKWAIDYALSHEIDINCIVDADPTLWGLEYKNIKIHPPKKLMNCADTCEVLISNYPVFIKDICKLLSPLGFIYGHNLFACADKINHQMFMKNSFAACEKITKGGSGNSKYIVEHRGRKGFAQIADITQCKRDTFQFTFLRQATSKNISVAYPIKNEAINIWGSYMLFNLVDGIDLLDIIHEFSEREQYLYGVKAGQLLRMIHGLEMEIEPQIWMERPYSKALRYSEYTGMIFKENEKLMIDFIRDKAGIDANQPKSILHGDFQLGNIMVDAKKLIAVDFNGYRYGSKWNDFSRTTWSGMVSPFFSTGQVHGYFDGEPPHEFWEHLIYYTLLDALNVYIDIATLMSQDMIKKRLVRNCDILNQHNMLSTHKPTWYKSTIPK